MGLIAGHQLAKHFEVFAVFAEAALIETAEGFGGIVFDQDFGERRDGIGDEVALVAVGAGDAADFAFKSFDHLLFVEGGKEVFFADGGDVFENIRMLVIVALHGGKELFPVLRLAVLILGESYFLFPDIDDEGSGALGLLKKGEGGVPFF